MFIGGIRKFDRVRGDGWLDCPNCHEHAAQDVVDEMRFAALSFYRITPVARRRVLRCRRCGYRRPATVEEMSRLRTAGKRVARAWLAPVGLSPFIAAGLIVLIVAARNSTSAATGPSYTTVNASPVAPISLQIPPGYNHSAVPAESASAPGLYTASSGTFTMRLRRYPVSTSPMETINRHFNDDVGILSGDFPSAPPAPTPVKIAGQDGLRSTIKYLQQGASSVLDLYTFNHDGVSYMLSFLYVGAQGTQEADATQPVIVNSLKFTADETPPPAAASPSAVSSTSSAAAPSPSPSPSH